MKKYELPKIHSSQRPTGKMRTGDLEPREKYPPSKIQAEQKRPTLSPGTHSGGKIKCQECRMKINVKDLGEHRDTCPVRQVQCPHCSISIASRLFSSHQNVCSKNINNLSTRIHIEGASMGQSQTRVTTDASNDFKTCPMCKGSFEIRLFASHTNVCSTNSSPHSNQAKIKNSPGLRRPQREQDSINPTENYFGNPPTGMGTQTSFRRTTTFPNEPNNQRQQNIPNTNNINRGFTENHSFPNTNNPGIPSQNSRQFPNMNNQNFRPTGRSQFPNINPNPQNHPGIPRVQHMRNSGGVDPSARMNGFINHARTRLGPSNNRNNIDDCVSFGPEDDVDDSYFYGDRGLNDFHSNMRNLQNGMRDLHNNMRVFQNRQTRNPNTADIFSVSGVDPSGNTFSYTVQTNVPGNIVIGGGSRPGQESFFDSFSGIPIPQMIRQMTNLGQFMPTVFSENFPFDFPNFDSIFPQYGGLAGNNEFVFQMNQGPQPPRGLDQSEINNIPTTVFQEKKPDANATKKATTDRKVEKKDETNSVDNSCVVCLSDFKSGDRIRTMPCTHKFHKSCIDTWLKEKGSCPICRHNLTN